MSQFYRRLAIITGSALAISTVLTAPAAALREERPKRERGKAAAPAQPAPKFTPSKAYLPLAQALDKAILAKDAAAADAALAAAAAAVTTADDRYLQAARGLQVGLLKNDEAQQAASIDAMLASGLMPPEDNARFSYFSGRFAYQAKDYPKAIARLGPAIAGGFTDNNNAHLMLTDAHAQIGDADGSLAAARAAMAVYRAEGKRVPEDLFVRPAQALQKAGRTSELLDVLAMRVAEYPNQATWHNTTLMHLQQAGDDKALMLDILRLMYAAEAMTQRGEYLEYAALATEAGLPGEVVKMIDQLWDRGTYPRNDPRLKEIHASQAARAASDRASNDAAYRAAPTAANARIMRATADALFGFGDYGRAAEVYGMALAKGGVDPDLLTLRQGMALAKAGDAAGAKAALAKTGGTRKQLAQLWTIFVDSKATPAAPQPPAA